MRYGDDYHAAWTLNGEIIEGGIEAFIADNSGLDEETCTTLRALEFGEMVVGGGGAQPQWTIERVST